MYVHRYIKKLGSKYSKIIFQLLLFIRHKLVDGFLHDI